MLNEGDPVGVLVVGTWVGALVEEVGMSVGRFVGALVGLGEEVGTRVGEFVGAIVGLGNEDGTNVGGVVIIGALVGLGEEEGTAGGIVGAIAPFPFPLVRCPFPVVAFICMNSDHVFE